MAFFFEQNSAGPFGIKGMQTVKLFVEVTSILKPFKIFKKTFFL